MSDSIQINDPVRRNKLVSGHGYVSVGSGHYQSNQKFAISVDSLSILESLSQRSPTLTFLIINRACLILCLSRLRLTPLFLLQIRPLKMLIFVSQFVDVCPFTDCLESHRWVTFMYPFSTDKKKENSVEKVNKVSSHL